MCLFLLPSAEDTEDKGAMDVAPEAGGSPAWNKGSG